jgi:hypothetical protein
MKPGFVIELAIICAAFMAPPLWVGWAYWKAGGREDLLRRITHRCEVHDRPTPIWIRQLEAELGMGPKPTSGEIAKAGYSNPHHIPCGHDWCRAHSGR